MRGWLGRVLCIGLRCLEVASDELASVGRTKDEAIDDRVAKRLDEVERERWSAIGRRVKESKRRVETPRAEAGGEVADHQRLPEAERRVDWVAWGLSRARGGREFASADGRESREVLRGGRAFEPA